MNAQIPTYIPLAEASARYDVAGQTLTRAVQDGIIRAVRINGGVAVAEEDVRTVAIQADESLRGRPIRVTEAAERYGISLTTISTWAAKGLVRVIEQRPKLLVLDEADVKLAAQIFQQARTETGSFVRAGWVLKRTLDQLRALQSMSQRQQA